MGRNLASENRSSTAPSSKSAKSSRAGGGGKKEKLSVSVILASMEKPKLSSTAASKNSKLKPELDMPPSSDVGEADIGDADEIPKELKKREKKEQIAAANADHARKEALREDTDVFNVVIGTRAFAFDPDGDDATADANLGDISVENFTVSAAGKDLLQNATLKISHGKRYDLVGPNGKGGLPS